MHPFEGLLGSICSCKVLTAVLLCRPQGESCILLKDYLAAVAAAEGPEPRPSKAEWTLIALKLLQVK